MWSATAPIETLTIFEPRHPPNDGFAALKLWNIQDLGKKNMHLKSGAKNWFIQYKN